MPALASRSMHGKLHKPSPLTKGSKQTKKLTIHQTGKWMTTPNLHTCLYIFIHCPSSFTKGLNKTLHQTGKWMTTPRKLHTFFRLFFLELFIHCPRMYPLSRTPDQCHTMNEFVSPPSVDPSPCLPVPVFPAVQTNSFNYGRIMQSLELIKLVLL